VAAGRCGHLKHGPVSVLKLRLSSRSHCLRGKQTNGPPFSQMPP
jgi:hypothetical protein